MPAAVKCCLPPLSPPQLPRGWAAGPPAAAAHCRVWVAAGQSPSLVRLTAAAARPPRIVHARARARQRPPPPVQALRVSQTATTDEATRAAAACAARRQVTARAPVPLHRSAQLRLMQARPRQAVAWTSGCVAEGPWLLRKLPLQSGRLQYLAPLPPSQLRQREQRLGQPLTHCHDAEAARGPAKEAQPARQQQRRPPRPLQTGAQRWSWTAAGPAGQQEAAACPWAQPRPPWSLPHLHPRRRWRQWR
jgi:hypothetical protein